MNKKLSTVLLLVVFLAGLSLLLYPTISNYYNSVHQTNAIMDYAQNVDRMTEELTEQLLDEAREYNAAMARERRYAIPLGYEETYYSMLDATGSGVMAYIQIPSIEVTLPIMHGTSETVLSKAIGHLEFSSLPVGGESTHSVLSGHRGLPSSELFTNLDSVEIGDVFYIHVLGQTLEYCVDQILVVLPNEYEELGIVDGQDYVTLMTCTPYGVNSHRLLVRGVRLEADSSNNNQQIVIKNEIKNVNLMVVLPLMLVAISVVVFVFIAVTGKKKNRKDKDNEKK